MQRLWHKCDFRTELERLAESLGDKGDPFAAWESLEALKQKVSRQQNLLDETRRKLIDIGNRTQRWELIDPIVEKIAAEQKAAS